MVGCGTVFRLTPSPIPPWPATVLYDFFNASDFASNPIPGPVFDPSGALYGTTSSTAGGRVDTAGSVYRLTGAAFALTVDVSGRGEVTSSPRWFDCPTRCRGIFAAVTSVTLTPKPAAGRVFEGWGGACSGTGICTVKTSAEKDVTATFTSP
jgi:hypothetical protein